MMSGRYRHFDIAVIGLACCIGALALGGMLFMLKFYTGQIQNMVGIVYECDENAANELLRGMFTGRDEKAAGVEAAKSLGYTEEAFRLWNRLNVYGAVAVLGCAAAVILCGIVCLVVIRGRHQGMADMESEHTINRLTEDARAKEKYYEDRQQDIQVFMENVTHQLKTPLAAVMVNLELMDGGDREHDERLREKCIDNIEHMKELLMMLLNSARLRVGKLHFNKRRMDVASLVKRLELENDGLIVENMPSCMIDADEEWPYQAVNNIVSNGLEYGRVVLRGACQSDMVSLGITDEGPGVKKEEMSKLFERYYVGENSREDSTGIGLNLAYMVVKAHGGDIVVHSADGDTGCVIRIMLPIYNVKEKIKIGEAVRVL